MKIPMALIMMLASLTAVAEERVYMLGKLKIEGTTFTSVVFFQDASIRTVADCEREVMYGRNGQWQVFGHQVKKAGGVSLTVDYLCRRSASTIAVWQPRAPYDNVYRFDLRNGGMVLKAFDTYAGCVGFFKQQRQPETFEYFCAKANQAVTGK